MKTPEFNEYRIFETRYLGICFIFTFNAWEKNSSKHEVIALTNEFFKIDTEKFVKTHEDEKLMSAVSIHYFKENLWTEKYGEKIRQITEGKLKESVVRKIVK